MAPMPQMGGQMGAQMGMMQAPGAGVMVSPGGNGPKGIVRKPVNVVLLCMFTFGIYPLIWYFQTYNEVATFLNRPTPPWWKPMLLSMVTCNLYGLYLMLTCLGEVIAEVQQRANVQQPQNLGWMYVIPVYGIFLVQRELNTAWEAPG